MIDGVQDAGKDTKQDAVCRSLLIFDARAQISSAVFGIHTAFQILGPGPGIHGLAVLAFILRTLFPVVLFLFLVIRLHTCAGSQCLVLFHLRSQEAIHILLQLNNRLP